MEKKNKVWYSQDHFPDEVNTKHANFTVDVFCYFKDLDEHTHGWYDFSINKWFFLCNQQYRPKDRFKWRYFNDEWDKPIK